MRDGGNVGPIWRRIDWQVVIGVLLGVLVLVVVLAGVFFLLALWFSFAEAVGTPGSGV
jgi:hypothetical protein